MRAPLVRTGNAARAPDVAEEDLPRVVWQLAWPAVLTMLLQLTNGLVDMFFVGRLGPATHAAPTISGWFSRDARVIGLAASYLRVNALGEPFLAFSIVLGGALQGAGDTRFQAVVSVVTMWLLRLPATYWLCLGLGYGAQAAWWTMAVTTALQGLAIAAWWQRGRWKSVDV